MTDLNDATIRYRDAGLCNENQRGVLAATLEDSAASIAALSRAVIKSKPLTVAQFDALVDPEFPPDDQTRYIIAFGGFDPRINSFAMLAEELAEVTARALARGTPMTEDEIVFLERHIEPGVMY